MKSCHPSAALFVTLATGLLACEPASTGDGFTPDAGPAYGEADGGGGTAAAPGVSSSAIVREAAPDAPDADLRALVASQNAFALSLFRAAATPNTNALFSAFSVHQALSMAYAGARNKTRTAMTQVLGVSGDDVAFHRAQNALDLRLENQPAGDETHPAPIFRIANTLFAQTGLGLEAPFLDTLALNYGAGVGRVDYLADPEAARRSINGWVSDKTEGHIPELLTAGQVGTDTRLTLVDAVYFLGQWATAFDPTWSYAQTFHGLGGVGDVQAPFMHRTLDLAAAVTDEAVVVELPYAGDSLSMQILMPKGDLAAFEATLTMERLDTLLAGVTTEPTAIALPRFEMRVRSLLRQPLTTLGMGPAFGEADFSGITTETGLGITEVVHEAWMRVDEAGTEAAAATAVLMDAGATVEPDARAIAIDRPFLLLIRDRATGAILFDGRLSDPRG